MRPLRVVSVRQPIWTWIALWIVGAAAFTGLVLLVMMAAEVVSAILP
jgi:hypothetical protein